MSNLFRGKKLFTQQKHTFLFSIWYDRVTYASFKYSMPDLQRRERQCPNRLWNLNKNVVIWIYEQIQKAFPKMPLKAVSDLAHNWDKYTHKLVPCSLTFTVFWIVVNGSRKTTLCAAHHFCHIFMVMTINVGDELGKTSPRGLKNNFTRVLLKLQLI